MSLINELLKNVYENEYDLTNLKKFSTPKIYDANGDLSKRWYIYYSFRNPKDNKLKQIEEERNFLREIIKPSKIEKSERT